MEILKKSNLHLYNALAFVAQACKKREHNSQKSCENIIHFEHTIREKHVFAVATDGCRLHIVPLISDLVSISIEGGVDYSVKLTKNKIVLTRCDSANFPDWKKIISKSDVLEEPSSGRWWELETGADGLFINVEDMSSPIYAFAQCGVVINSKFLEDIVAPLGEGQFYVWQYDRTADYKNGYPRGTDVTKEHSEHLQALSGRGINGVFVGGLLFKRVSCKDVVGLIAPAMVAVIMPKVATDVMCVHPMLNKKGLDTLAKRFYNDAFYKDLSDVKKLLQERYDFRGL